MSKKTIIIVAVLVVVCLVAGGGVMFYSMNQDKEEKIYYYSPGEYFITNMKDSGSSLLKVSITIGYNNKKAAKDLEANNAVIRNAIVFTLRSKTKDEMKSQDIETVLSNEICAKLNQDLNVDYFVRIYFSDLVIQG